MRATFRTQKTLEPWQNLDTTPHIIIDNITKEYDGVPILKDLSLDIYKNEFFCLLGESGCGKTTLLRLLAGFEKPSKGRIIIDGQDMTHVPPFKRSVNMMFQSYALFPHMTVEQNVAFGLKQEKCPGKELKERVEEALALVKMYPHKKRRPQQLSGGQRQRVALARSLIKRPKVLLLDEPLAALDKQLREHTQLELVNIQESVGITFIMVTHDQEEAMTISSRMAVMQNGDIQQYGTPQELYEFPNCEYVARFVGTMNIFEGLILKETEEHTVIRSPELGSDVLISGSIDQPEGAQISIAIRPEKIHITKEPTKDDYNKVSGIVRDIAYLGDVSLYYIEEHTSGKMIQAMLPNLTRHKQQNITWDDVVYVSWEEDNCIVLTS